MKRFTLLSKSMCREFLVLMAGMYILLFALVIFCVRRFLIETFDPSVFLLLAIIITPFVFITFKFFHDGILKRFLLKCSIDDDGISYSGPLWKSRKINWSEVHTFGVYFYSVSYLSNTMIFFSTDRTELGPKTAKDAAVLSSNRVVIQYREDIWDALSEHMPSDIRKRIDEALRHQCNCFHKR